MYARQDIAVQYFHDIRDKKNYDYYNALKCDIATYNDEILRPLLDYLTSLNLPVVMVESSAYTFKKFITDHIGSVTLIKKRNAQQIIHCIENDPLIQKGQKKSIIKTLSLNPYVRVRSFKGSQRKVINKYLFDIDCMYDHPVVIVDDSILSGSTLQGVRNHFTNARCVALFSLGD